MPTLQEVLTRIDKDKINSQDEPKKTQWINEVNKIVHTRIHCSSEDYQELVFPDSNTQELVVGTPYDNMYDYYVYSMLDMLNMEFQSYNNYRDLFNKAYEDYHKYYRRNNMPKQIYIKNLK